MAIIAALAAALLYGLASVLQQWEAERQPSEQALRISLLGRLAKRPLWVLGLAMDAGGYVMQWLALSWGSLVIVQPLLVLGLLFALPVKARLVSCRFTKADWGGAVMCTLGLAVFLVVSRPAAGHNNVRPMTWAFLLLAGAVVIIPLLVGSRHRGPRVRAMALGTAGGVVYGLCAALTKTCSRLLSLGTSHLLSGWQTYMLITLGAGGMVLAQSAFQAGPLDVSLPALSATDPIVSVLIGAVAFGEAIRTGRLATPLEVIAFLLIIVGVFVLGRTDAVKAAEHRHVTKSEPKALA